MLSLSAGCFSPQSLPSANNLQSSAEISALIAHQLVCPSVRLPEGTDTPFRSHCSRTLSAMFPSSGPVRSANSRALDASPTCHLDQKAATLRQRDLSGEDAGLVHTDIAQEVVALLNSKTRCLVSCKKNLENYFFFSVLLPN